MALDINVSLIVPQAAQIIKDAFHSSAITAETVDYYESTSNNAGVMVMIFEKYFMRNSSRATLTVVVDNLRGYTHVHAAGSGGGQGALWNFDWGAKGNMERVIENALSKYEIR